jgi:hypothetical protein
MALATGKSVPLDGAHADYRILEDPSLKFRNRTSVDLKDR